MCKQCAKLCEFATIRVHYMNIAYNGADEQRESVSSLIVSLFETHQELSFDIT